MGKLRLPRMKKAVKETLRDLKITSSSNAEWTLEEAAEILAERGVTRSDPRFNEAVAIINNAFDAAHDTIREGLHELLDAKLEADLLAIHATRHPEFNKYKSVKADRFESLPIADGLIVVETEAEAEQLREFLDNEGNAIESLRRAVAALAKFRTSSKKGIRAIIELELNETNLREESDESNPMPDIPPCDGKFGIRFVRDKSTGKTSLMPWLAEKK